MITYSKNKNAAGVQPAAKLHNAGKASVSIHHYSTGRFRVASRFSIL